MSYALEDCNLCDTLGEPKQVVSMNTMVSEQFRFPRSKKKRIRRKWAKQMKNFRHRYTVMQVSKSTYDKIQSYLT